MDLREQIIRKLVTEYQQTQDGVVFHKLLKRVDMLLLKTIHDHVRKRPHLAKVDLRDLYHSAIVGMGRAVLTARDVDKGYKLTCRIMAYVRSQLNVDYSLNKKWKFSDCVPLEDGVEYCSTQDREIHTRREIELSAELSLMTDEYIGMVYHGYISVEDLLILRMRFGDSQGYKEIAKVIHTSQQNARERANRIMKKVRIWFEGFEI